MKKYTAIDLFAGAGGLSLGFMQTQKFDIKVAFENNPSMQETYRNNHPNVEIQGDVCKADYLNIKRKYGNIDVVIGGPPCQGFSNANRQKNHVINQNNMLVKQYLRAILELQPKAFVMENVSMLRSEVHRFFMEEGDEETIERCHIPVKDTLLHLLDDRYIFDHVLDIVQSKAEVLKYLWPESDYFELNVVYKASKNISKMRKSLENHRKKLTKISDAYLSLPDDNYIFREAKKAFLSLEKYYEGQIDIERIKPNIEPSIMIQRMLSRVHEIFSNNIIVDEFILNENGLSIKIRSFAVYDYIKGVLEAAENNYTICSDVLCAADYGAPQKRNRFVLIGIKRDISTKISLPNGRFNSDEYYTVREAIGDLEDVIPFVNIKDDLNGIKLQPKKDLSALATALRDSDILKNHIITKTTTTAMERFRAIKQGQNFHSLDESLKTNTYTDVSRTQNTIYLRLNYDEPCGTVVNVRKSMWIHPTLNRAISIREAARLQTFPDSFVFYGSKDKQYQQVGNAVPPIMAKAIAKKLARILSKSENKEAKDN